MSHAHRTPLRAASIDDIVSHLMVAAARRREEEEEVGWPALTGRAARIESRRYRLASMSEVKLIDSTNFSANNIGCVEACGVE